MKALILIVFYFKLCSGYTLTSYNATNFFNYFNFESISDPTHGTVAYVDYPTALTGGLARYTADNKVYLGVGKSFETESFIL